MSDSSLETSPIESESEFPRFLNRERLEEPPVVQPPPLPLAPWRRGVAITRVAIAGAATFCAIAIASAAIISVNRVPARVPMPPVAEAAQDDVADAVGIVAAFESRLSFAASLTAQGLAHNAGMEVDLAGNGSALAESADSDALAVMMMRAGPSLGASLATSNVGQSVWVSAAREADNLELSLGGTESEPVIADAEILSKTRPMLSSEHVSNQTVGDAREQTAVKSDETRSDETRSGGDDKLGTKTVKPPHRVRVRKVVTVAQDVARPKRRARRAEDAYKSKSSDRLGDDKATAVVSEENVQEKPAGPISKFFAWLKGGASKPATDDEKPTGLGLAPQN